MHAAAGTSAILVAGGLGVRMQAPIPKQFLDLQGKPIALYSFELFCSLPEIDELIVVCGEQYQSLFQQTSLRCKPVRFAAPGERRQDSVYNGLAATAPDSEYICIHDAARPFIDAQLVQNVLAAGKQCGAATLGLPLKFTIKECSADNMVQTTPERSKMWEIQTPQVIRKSILQEGFNYVYSRGVTVTDDVLLAELLGHPVRMVEGAEKNIKITTPHDLLLAQKLCTSYASA
jgi:2-C-methyl-D-erythritol 4-phosphate cytidylyltransferase